jgi:import inner membrane translocase subunit TIM21
MEPDNRGGGGGFWSGVAGLFSGLTRGSKGSSGSGSVYGDESSKGEMYEEGEVHGDLIKDEKGNFVWRYLIVDMPSE